MSEDNSSRFGPPDPSTLAIRALIAAWDRGERPDIDRLWKHHDPLRSLEVLASLIKQDLKCRFCRGERPAVSEYLDLFPELRDGASGW